MVIWLVGLSGSGKSTIGNHIDKLWKQQASNTVMVDGDAIRRIFQHDKHSRDYSIEGRYCNSQRIAEICAWLDAQNINVICCTLCLFEDVMLNNRSRFSSYYQVSLKASLDLLQRRDPKGLYQQALEGQQDNVVGYDIPFPEPPASDFVIDMDSNTSSALTLARQILVRSGVL